MLIIELSQLAFSSSDFLGAADRVEALLPKVTFLP
jgi:hypothetical protein